MRAAANLLLKREAPAPRPAGRAVDPRDAIAPTYGFKVSVIPSLQRSYAFLVHDRVSRETAVIDPHDAGPIIALARAQGMTIDHVLVTHHHNCAGNLALKRATGCKIHGPAAEADRIPGLDIAYKGGDLFALGTTTAEVLSVPGHTIGHVAYWFAGPAALFCGDVLTPLGCGYLNGGTPQEMWTSLDRIRRLPPETLTYSGFECAQANARFARSLDPANMWLQARAKRIDQACKAGQATVPATLEDECCTNPFLRCDDPRLAAALKLADATPVEVFAALRKRRDQFQNMPH